MATSKPELLEVHGASVTRFIPQSAMQPSNGRHGWHSNRHLGMALSAMARGVLSEGSGAARRVALRVPALPHDRIERLVLFAAAAGKLRTLARRDATGFRVRDQGPALHHPRQAAA